jgi:RimJ/RimL family protein N-acetyltransferase
MTDAPRRLREHEVTLTGERVTLRPLTEDDWDVLLRWNNDPEVLWFAEGDHITSYTLEDLQGVYRGVSQTAFCLVIEHDGAAIGECWLQQHNLERVLRRERGNDIHRIDVMIGETEWWGRGIGSEAVALLVRFAFEVQGADAVFASDVGDYNERSRRMFERLGFELYAELPQPEGAKARVNYDLILRREAYERI